MRDGLQLFRRCILTLVEITPFFMERKRWRHTEIHCLHFEWSFYDHLLISISTRVCFLYYSYVWTVYFYALLRESYAVREKILNLIFIIHTVQTTRQLQVTVIYFVL